jgi:hypothetical protein
MPGFGVLTGLRKVLLGRIGVGIGGGTRLSKSK